MGGASASGPLQEGLFGPGSALLVQTSGTLTRGCSATTALIWFRYQQVLS